MLHLSSLKYLRIHIGSILNALSGVFGCGLVAVLSERYFPEQERGAATALIFLALTAGNLFNFSLAPIFIDESWKLKYFLLIWPCFSFLLIICFIIYYPKPGSLPCDTSKEKVEYSWRNFQGICMVALIWALQNGVR